MASRYTTIALALALAGPASAYDPERAMANLAGEFASCSAYLMLVSTAMKENDADTSAKYLEQAAYFRAYAIEASNEDVSNARINVYAREMLAEIDGDLGNVVILFEQHGELCADISNDVEARLQYWLVLED